MHCTLFPSDGREAALLMCPGMCRSQQEIPEVSFRAEAGGFSSPNELAYEFGFIASDEGEEDSEQVRRDL